MSDPCTCHWYDDGGPESGPHLAVDYSETCPLHGRDGTEEGAREGWLEADKAYPDGPSWEEVYGPLTFRRLGPHRPPCYAADLAGHYLGNVQAMQAGWAGQSRSSNTYKAFPARRGIAEPKPLPGTYPTRQAAAQAMWQHQEQA
jgi:hypothetical protein